MSDERSGVNKYAEYRRIRFERTNRPLGKMSLWRVVLGLVLLASVFLLSGFVSSSLASRGRFRAAESLMLSPHWMETYRPALKAYIEAGVLYESGDYEGALAAFSALSEPEAARTMASLSALRLAEARFAHGETGPACEALSALDPAALPEEERAELYSLCRALLDASPGVESPAARATLEALLSTADGQDS